MADERIENELQEQVEKDDRELTVNEPIPKAPDVEIEEEDEEDGSEAVGTPLQQKVAALSEKNWKIVQTVLGLVLGGVTVAFLFAGSSTSNGDMWYTVYAALVALVVPRLLEQAVDRKLNFTRTILCVAIAVGLILEAVMIFGFGKHIG